MHLSRSEQSEFERSCLTSLAQMQSTPVAGLEPADELPPMVHPEAHPANVEEVPVEKVSVAN